MLIGRLELFTVFDIVHPILFGKTLRKKLLRFPKQLVI